MKPANDTIQRQYLLRHLTRVVRALKAEFESADTPEKRWGVSRSPAADRVAAHVGEGPAEALGAARRTREMRLRLAHMRLADKPAPPSHRNLLPLPILIRCLEERIAAVKQGIGSIGSLAELTEQAIPYLRQLQRLDELH
jgi:hypothetical protein